MLAVPLAFKQPAQVTSTVICPGAGHETEVLDKIKAPTINYVQTAKASQMEKMKVFIKHGKRDPQELRRSADELRYARCRYC